VPWAIFAILNMFTDEFRTGVRIAALYMDSLPWNGSKG